MSIHTGPGLPCFAKKQAFSISYCTLFLSFTFTAYLVVDLTELIISNS